MDITVASLYFKARRALRKVGVDVYVLPMPKKSSLIKVNGKRYSELFNTQTNWLRIPMYADIIEELRAFKLDGKRAVEFGGSEGLLRRQLELAGAKYEVAPDYPAVDLEKIPYRNETIDVVVIDQVLEHVKHPWLVVEEIARVLKEGGLCVCTTVFEYPIHKGANYGDYYRFSPEGLSALFEDFEIVCSRGWGSAEVIKLVYGASERGPEGQPPLTQKQLYERGIYDYTDSMNYLITWCIAKKRRD